MFQILQGVFSRTSMIKACMILVLPSSQGLSYVELHNVTAKILSVKYIGYGFCLYRIKTGHGC